MDTQLFNLLRDFFALTPTIRLQFPSDCTATQINDFLIHEILDNEHYHQYPPSVQYQRRFWKWAIENLEGLARTQNSEEEGDEFEIDSRIYDTYISMMSPGGPITGWSDPSVRDQICGKGVPNREAPPSQSYITHFWSRPTTESASPSVTSQPLANKNICHKVTLLESRTTIENGTTGLRTWLASFVLAQYLVLHPEIVASKCILELGSGIGFLGIVIASLQQLHEVSPSETKGSIWMTDINDEVLTRCRENVNLPCNISFLHSDTHYCQLDWLQSLEGENNTLKALIHEKINPDVILGADVIFDPSLIPALVGTLKISLEPSISKTSKIAITALTVRNKDTMDRFLDCVKRASMHIQEIAAGFDSISFTETIESHNSCSDVKLFLIKLIT